MHKTILEKITETAKLQKTGTGMFLLTCVRKMCEREGQKNQNLAGPESGLYYTKCFFYLLPGRTQNTLKTI